MNPGDVINAPDLPEGALARDGDGDYYIRYGRRGHMAFAVGTRPWCGWGDRPRFFWWEKRGRLEIVAMEVPIALATGTNLRQLAEAFCKVHGSMETWEPGAIVASARSVHG